MNLFPFTSDDPAMQDFHSPVFDGELRHLYATDGRIAVRYEHIPGKPLDATYRSEPQIASKIAILFNKFPDNLPDAQIQPIQSDAWRQLTLKEDRLVPCCKCNETGTHSCDHCGNSSKCHQCQGKGSLKIENGTSLYGCTFADRHLIAMASLPECQLYCQASDIINIFTFKGGIGVVKQLDFQPQTQPNDTP